MMRTFVLVVLVVLMIAPAAVAQGSPALANPAEALAEQAGATAAVEPEGCRQRVAASAPPVGVGSCRGVRPGALIQVGTGDDASLCTMNFAFTGRTATGAKVRYIGTAGHCVLGEGVLGQGGSGEKRWAAGSGPVAFRSDGKRIGRVAYAVLKGEYDFALVRIDAGVPVSPRMCTFGGPTGMRSDRPSAPVRLQYHGQGLALGDTVPGRTAVALGMRDPLHVWAFGAAISGDSGAAVTSSDGRAVGVLLAVGAAVGPTWTNGSSDSGTVNIGRIGPYVARAERYTNVNLTLRRAAVL